MNRLSIKNMVCPRCIEAVENILENNAIAYSSVILGEVTLKKAIDENTAQLLANQLEQKGFELIQNESIKLSEQTKNLIIEKIYGEEGLFHFHDNWSDWLSKKLQTEYPRISKVFKEHQRQSIEQYIIAQKTERVKELLTYGELSVKEIAYHLGYANVPHLSGQFKKLTGLSPTQYTKSNDANAKRKTIDF